MRVPEVRAAILVAAAVVLSEGAPARRAPGRSDAAPSNAGGPSAVGAASDATGAGSASAPSAGGDPTTNACGLLTAEEIQQATGIAVGPGTLQNSDNQSDCEWASTKSDTQSVGLTVSMYDEFPVADGQQRDVQHTGHRHRRCGLQGLAVVQRLDDQGEGLPGRPGDHRLPGDQGCGSMPPTWRWPSSLLTRLVIAGGSCRSARLPCRGGRTP